MADRYFLDKIVIDGVDVGPGMSPVSYLTSDYYSIDFRSIEKSIKLSNTSIRNMNDYGVVRVVYDKTASPSGDNKAIGCACLGAIVTNLGLDSMKVGPVIKRSYDLSTFPGKISFAGGMFEHSDHSLLRTVVRELTEELCLDTYLSARIFDLLYKNARPTHLFISHPSVRGVRRFNIVIVYTITLTYSDFFEFRNDKFDTKEVASIVSFNTQELIQSLIENNPYEAEGWTPNGAMVVLDMLKSVILALGDINTSDSSALNLMSAIEILRDYTYKSQKYKSIEVPAISKSNSEDSGVIEGKKPKMQKMLFLNPEQCETVKVATAKKRGELEKLQCHRGSLDIRRITTETDAIASAEDLAYLFNSGGQFVAEVKWAGFLPMRSRDSNYKQQYAVFESIIANLRNKFIIKCSLTPWLTGGNEYYDEEPEQTGWILSMNR